MKTNRHILIATGLYPPDIGGPATYSKLLEDGLPKRGFTVTVVSFGSVRHLPVGVRHIAYVKLLVQRGKGVDVIYALDPVSVGLPAWIAATLLKKQFMLRIAGDYAWEQGTERFGVTEHLDSFSKKRWGHPWVMLLKLVERMVAGGAAKVIVPSKYFKTIVRNWGVDEKKIRVIESAVERIPDQGDKEKLRSLLQFDGTFLISAGRLVPWKGFEALISIMPPLVERHRRLKLLIVGAGPQEEALQRQIGELNLEGTVALAGALPRDILFKYIKAADLFVLNTGYEGLSHQLLEVLSIGTPIVTTNAGGNAEVIENGKHGLLVRYNDTRMLTEAIEKLLGNPELRAKFSAEGKKRVGRFSIDQMLAHLSKELS